MEFRDYAATHTTALFTRLLAGPSAQSRQQLSKIRAALDEAVSAMEAALDGPRSLDTRDVDTLVDQLAGAATAQADEHAARLAEPLRAELASHADEIALLAGSLEAAQGQADALRAELETARKDLDAAISERARFEEAAGAAHSQAEAAEAKLDAVTSLFKTSNSRVKALERAQEEHDRLVRALQSKLHAQTTATDARTDGGTLSLLDEMLGSFEALSAATTIADVLTTLTEQLAADFCRVALFRVKGNRLEGEHQIGIDLPADVAKVMMPLGMDSLLTRAATSGDLMRLSGSELADSSRAPFAGTPTCALALPIVLNGETLAVVYADDSGQAESERPPVNLDRSARVADALRHHAVALLSRLTNELKAVAELRSYADLLLKEMEQMYDADVEAGQSGEPLLNLLRSNLEYARTIYGSRVTHEGPAATSLLDDQIATLIDTRREASFARDLAAALGPADAERSETRASFGA